MAGDQSGERKDTDATQHISLDERCVREYEKGVDIIEGIFIRCNCTLDIYYLP